METRTKQPYSEKLRKQRERQQREKIARNTFETADGLNYYLDKLSYEVVKDPIPISEGGFRPGAKLDQDEVKIMIQMGILVPGTILKNKVSGKRKMVIAKTHRRNKHVYRILAPVN